MAIPGDERIIEIVKSKGLELYCNSHRLGFEWDELLREEPAKELFYGKQYVVISKPILKRVEDRTVIFKDGGYFATPPAALFFPQVSTEDDEFLHIYRSERLISAADNNFPVGIVWPNRHGQTVKLIAPTIKGDAGPSSADVKLESLVKLFKNVS